MNNRNRKFIVWDWNGTLQDDFSVAFAATNLNMREIGKPEVDANTYRECFDVPIEKLYRNLGLTEEEIDRHLKPLQDSFFDTYDKLVKEVDFREGGRDTLNLAIQHGILQVILSNHLTEAIDKDLRRLKKLETFHTILAWPSREKQFVQPKGNLLPKYINDNNLEPENGIIVGDSPEEVKIAREYGLTSVAISGGYNSLSILEKAKPDYIISSLTEMEDILIERGFIK